MTAFFQFDLVAGGTLVGRSQTDIKNQTNIPEPGSVALLGIGLLGLMRLTWRREQGLR